jgi:Glycoside Hydrolase Family 113
MFIGIQVMQYFKIIVVGACVCCGLTAFSCSSNPIGGQPPRQRGVALGLFSEDPNWSYVDMLEEMRHVGTSHVAIVVPWYMKTALDTEVFKHPRYTVPMHTVRRTIKDARARGMKIFLFPILRVDDKTHGWRGTLNPRDRQAFYTNYVEYILRFARLAEEMKIPLLSVGSELSSMDVDESQWREIISKVREVYKGDLTYSANWDHYEKVAFFDALDYAGVTGYFELADEGVDPSVDQLISSWSDIKLKLVRWQQNHKRPLILTEVGYLSQKNAAAWPWKEGADEEIDLELQRRCYEAYRRVWSGEKRLEGSYFWNWFGWGGPDSKEYTPRNKPAAAEVRKWFLSSKQ